MFEGSLCDTINNYFSSSLEPFVSSFLPFLLRLRVLVAKHIVNTLFLRPKTNSGGRLGHCVHRVYFFHLHRRPSVEKSFNWLTLWMWIQQWDGEGQWWKFYPRFLPFTLEIELVIFFLRVGGFRTEINFFFSKTFSLLKENSQKNGPRDASVWDQFSRRHFIFAYAFFRPQSASSFFLLHRHKVAQWIKKMLFHKQCFENKQFYHVKLISFLCFSVILSRSGDGGRNIVWDHDGANGAVSRACCYCLQK